MKDSVVSFRCSPDKKRELKAKAKEAGLTLSEYACELATASFFNVSHNTDAANKTINELTKKLNEALQAKRTLEGNNVFQKVFEEAKGRKVSFYKDSKHHVKGTIETAADLQEIIKALIVEK